MARKRRTGARNGVPRFTHRSISSTGREKSVPPPKERILVTALAKVLVSVDEKLLARIDRAARELSLSRSAYLSRLAAREVEASHGPGRATATRRALRSIDELFAANRHEGGVTAAVRQERASY